MSKWQSERSIHEMLKDTPPIRESSDSITSGTEAKFPTSRSMPFPPTYASEATQNGRATPGTVLRTGPSKLESLRSWGLSTYKCTKQLLYEKLGKSARTVDTELENEIAGARDTQRRYRGVLRLTTALATQLAAAAASQRQLADAFSELAHREPALRAQFLYNADTQRALTRNGEVLVGALTFFNSALHTLAERSIEDTLLTARQYEAARVEYDAYRSELEAVSASVSAGAASSTARAEEETARLRDKYRRLRDDCAVKLHLLRDNRIKVMNKQLLLFHNAIAAYFSGNNVALEAAVRHLNLPQRAPIVTPGPPNTTPGPPGNASGAPATATAPQTGAPAALPPANNT